MAVLLGSSAVGAAQRCGLGVFDQRLLPGLVANSCLSESACGIVSVHTLMSGDGGQIIVPIARTVQGYVKGRPGEWTSDTTFNPFGVSP